MPSFLFGCSVFALFLVFEHAQIRLIPRWRYLASFQSFEYCATRFMGMGAVAVAAIFG